MKINTGENYPSIGLNEFSIFCRDSSLIDNWCHQSTIDKIWKAVNARDAVKINTLERNKLIEILVRVAYAKYKATGMAQTWEHSVEQLIKHLKKSFEPIEWQSFRDNQLWKNDINNLYINNLDNMRVIYNSIFKKYGVDGYKECMD